MMYSALICVGAPSAATGPGRQLTPAWHDRAKPATAVMPDDAGTVVIAADSGLDVADQLGLAVDLAVGDFDSVSPDALRRAVERGIEIRRFPADKDRTDLELALDALAEWEFPSGRGGWDRLAVLGGDGGRFDHLMANVAAVARFAELRPNGPDPSGGRRHPAEMWMGGQLAVIVGPRTPRWSAVMPTGTAMSVIVWSEHAVVSASGLRWSLSERRIDRGDSLGVSNEAIGGVVEVEAHDGQVLVVVPDAGELT